MVTWEVSYIIILIHLTLCSRKSAKKASNNGDVSAGKLWSRGESDKGLWCLDRRRQEVASGWVSAGPCLPSRVPRIVVWVALKLHSLASIHSASRQLQRHTEDSKYKEIELRSRQSPRETDAGQRFRSGFAETWCKLRKIAPDWGMEIYRPFEEQILISRNIYSAAWRMFEQRRLQLAQDLSGRWLLHIAVLVLL